jgi:MFS family permease
VITARLSVRRQLILALFWFGISFVWGALLAVALPLLLVPEHPGPGNPLLVSPSDKNTALSILESGGLLVAILVQPAAGAASDRLRTRWGRRRPMIAVGAVGAIASLCLISLSPTFVFLVAIYCLLQFSMNVAQGAYQGLLPDTVGGEQRGQASGFLGVATLAGQVAGAVAAGIVAPRPICFVIAGVVALTAGATIIGVPEHAPAAHSSTPGFARSGERHHPVRALRGYLSEFARYPDFCWVVFSRFLIFTSLAGIQRFALNYIRDTFHGNFHLFGWDLGSAQAATSAMLAVVILFGLAATYPAVRLSDRIGRRRVIVSAAIVGAVASALFLFATTVTQVVLFALPAAVCFGMVISVDWAFMADLAPRRRAGKFLGFSNVATAGAQAAAPAILGPVIDLVNSHSGAPGISGSAGYRVLFAVSAVFFLLGGAVLRRVRVSRLPEADIDLSAHPAAAFAP